MSADKTTKIVVEVGEEIMKAVLLAWAKEKYAAWMKDSSVTIHIVRRNDDYATQFIFTENPEPMYVKKG